MNHSFYLQQAFSQARFALGGSDPNPAVGAVVVAAEGDTLGQGFTQAIGKPHAEVMAIREAQQTGYDLTKATLYVTLEPCCHYGRTPPCTQAILTAKLRQVVVANRDFSPVVAGRSLTLLKEQGIEVLHLSQPAFLEASHFTLGPFFYRLRYQRPAVVIKWAQTVDGFLAPQSGPSGPITSPFAQVLLQRLRRFYPVVLTGAGTVITDKPKLTRRATKYDHNYNLAQQNFLGQLFARFDEEQPTAAYEGAYHRYFILPSKVEKAKDFLLGMVPPYEEIRFFAKTEEGDWFHQDCLLTHNIPLMTQPSYPMLWNTIIERALSDGANAILVETGPTLAQQLLLQNKVDALYVFIAAHSASQLAFVNPRTLPLAIAIAQQNYDVAKDFGLHLRCSLHFGLEKLLYFTTEAYWQSQLS